MNCVILLSFFYFFDLYAAIYPYKTSVENYLKRIELTEQKSGIDLIDCIYVINLDERPEKWERMQSLFAMKDLHINRVSGINGWKIPKEIQEDLAGTYPVRLSGGRLGCILSHLSVLKDAEERGFELIWVCEDDVEFVDDAQLIPKTLAHLNQIDPDWDVFYTDINSKNERGEVVQSVSSDFRPDQQYLPLSYYTSRAIIDQDIMKIGQRFGAYSVIYSRKGIQKILDYFTHVYLWTAWDIDIHYVPSIRQYSSTKDIVSIWTQSSISDTQRDPLVKK
ncbi:MAG: glycosyltransferase family 25 protein [Verrucomicrobia bacterium]|nr:glycosyltransferase family 25 protein [Verrucomicrobiota bacterium]